MIKRLTPILYVEAIEPCLPFWLKGLGFEKTMEVPEGDHLGFAALQLSEHELMLQTRSSIRKDIPDLEEEVMRGPSVLFLEVESLDGLEEQLTALGAVVAHPRRRTFYGADEIYVRSPGGHLVGLAAFTHHEN